MVIGSWDESEAGMMSDHLPTPESADHPSATHGDFHDRPGFRGHDETIVYCPCDDPMDAPDSECPVHGESTDA
jgi:hypothetical protein